MNWQHPQKAIACGSDSQPALLHINARPIHCNLIFPKTAVKSLTTVHCVLHLELKNSHRIKSDQEGLIYNVPGLIPGGLLIMEELNV